MFIIYIYIYLNRKIQIDGSHYLTKEASDILFSYQNLKSL